MKISDVLIHRVRGQYAGPTFPAGERQAQQLDIYPEFNQRAYAGDTPKLGMPVEALYVEVKTDAGTSGFWGPIEEYQAFPLLKSLRPYLIGRDPLATELLFDQMARMDRHGRSGLFMTAISAIDCALWDLKAKVFDLPVYRLLGGPTRPAVPAYASMLGFPDHARMRRPPLPSNTRARATAPRNGSSATAPATARPARPRISKWPRLYVMRSARVQVDV